jgi:DNA invertase Pin-like site-specific DNA recombinase
MTRQWTLSPTIAGEALHGQNDNELCKSEKSDTLSYTVCKREQSYKQVVKSRTCDRLARSTKHLLQVLDELNGFGIQFLSQREAIDTEGPLGRAIIVIVSAIAELERSLIVERVRAGMRRARLEGRQIGRARLDIDREQVVIDRRGGMSLTNVAKRHKISLVRRAEAN